MLVKPISQIQQHNDGWSFGNYFMRNKKIGSGGFGKVFEGKNQNNGKLVAIKYVSVKDADMKEFEALVKIAPIHSPFILNLHDAFLYKQTESLYLVFDRCIGSLDDYFIERFPNHLPGTTNVVLPEREALEIFCHIVEGCTWLWKNSICHRDIKPENILYRYDEAAKKNVFIIADFGLSTLKLYSLATGAGTLYFMAPEIILGKKYDYLCDVWSLGLTLHQMLFGEIYYNDFGADAIKKKILNKEYKLTADQKMRITPKTTALLEGMIKHDPKQRFTKEQLKGKMQEFPEYESVRKVMLAFEHENKFVGQEKNQNEVKLQYAKGLMDNAWEAFQNGYYKKSFDMNKEALQIYQGVLGDDAAETKFAMIRYAQDLMFLRQLEEAKTFGEKALKLYEKGNNHKEEDLARAYMIVGNIYDEIKDYKTSRKYLETAVSMRLKIHGEYHRDTAAALNNLGCTLRDQGDLAGAKQNYERSLKIFIKLFGEDHYETSFKYHNLSLVLYDLGDYKEALKFCRKAKIIFEKHFGKNHERTIETQNHESNILAAMKSSSK